MTHFSEGKSSVLTILSELLQPNEPSRMLFILMTQVGTNVVLSFLTFNK